MAEDQNATKRPRKTVNYAAMESLDISDEDEFSGFSSPAHTTEPGNPGKGNKMKNKHLSSNLSKKRKLGRQKHSSVPSLVSSSEETSISDDEHGDDGCFMARPISTRNAAQPRPSLQDKLFQRDLDAALELSRQSAGLCSDDGPKERNPHNAGTVNPPARSTPADPTCTHVPVSNPDEKTSTNEVPTSIAESPVSPPKVADSIAVINKLLVPVEVHNSKNGDHEMRDGLKVLPHTTMLISGDSVESGTDGRLVTEGNNESTSPTIGIDSDNCDSPARKPNNPSLKKRKTLVVNSDDDDFNAITVEPEIINNKAKAGTNKRNRSRAASEALSPHQAENRQKGQDEACGRSRRPRKAVSFKQESESEDSEAEWAELEELDEDNLSEPVSEDGSDFEPSPKKKAPPNKKSNRSNSSTKRTTNNSSIKTAIAAGTNTKFRKTLSDNKEHITNTTFVMQDDSKIKPQKQYLEISDQQSTKENSPKSAPAAVAQLKHSKRSSSPSRPTVRAVSNVGIKSAEARSTVQNSLPSAPRLGLARAAFKCPMQGTAGPDKAVVATAPSPGSTLRLGLSRRANFKPLHPNAAMQ